MFFVATLVHFLAGSRLKCLSPHLTASDVVKMLYVALRLKPYACEPSQFTQSVWPIRVEVTRLTHGLKSSVPFSVTWTINCRVISYFTECGGTQRARNLFRTFLRREEKMHKDAVHGNVCCKMLTVFCQ